MPLPVRPSPLFYFMLVIVYRVVEEQFYHFHIDSISASIVALLPLLIFALVREPRSRFLSLICWCRLFTTIFLSFGRSSKGHLLLTRSCLTHRVVRCSPFGLLLMPRIEWLILHIRSYFILCHFIKLYFLI